MADSPEKDLISDNEAKPVRDSAEGSSGDMPSLGMDMPALDIPDASSSAYATEPKAEMPVAKNPVAPNTDDNAYRVLARKYRPQTFSELIGQDAMVQTLGNAIKRDRLAHAFLMTGVRGVGKTSTARLIAKALNCIGTDGEGGPTIDPCGQCEPCTAIAEGRHIDVIEMDAASHTGVDDVREIIEAVRYAAVSARYKIYIIDEVHMLSKNAFNALLKTLEEPPAHVKFLFATTEVNKVPITVLSRCQRFDLKRITADMLASHFAKICVAEGVEAEADALGMIAQAAEGSVRDGLSILDQAIAHADMQSDGENTQVTTLQVRDMLGLSDRGAVRRLLGHILEGDAKKTLAAMDEQHVLGVEPLALVRALMDYVHQLTLAKIKPLDQVTMSENERAQLNDWAARLTHPQLHRLWQLLLKGHDEVQRAPMPAQACQMALLRLLHATNMPDPGKLIKDLAEGKAVPTQSAQQDHSAPDGDAQGTAAQQNKNPHAGVPDNFADFVEWLDRTGNLTLAQILHDRIRVVEYEPGRLIYQTATDFTQDFAPQLRDALLQLTEQRWQIEIGEGEAQISLMEQAEARKQAARAELESSPMVKAAKAAFPDAELLDNDAVQRGNGQWSKSA
ncbi:DNA polymerase III subunit gamma/tau [Sphingorhabdus sp. Alg239-R122]|uniref:DNA polymerase III subunit gamma/tau n=1 Tax=Sphingorhabdus sp. Alg239-R122 TaxID=2305989 RepID=UPI0013D9BE3E|nr:DNA polymerase III subunit gamma/tau [Sphingorhabdus sp. Alg239-R122]